MCLGFVYAAFEVLVVWEYMLALEVNTLGVRRLLTVTSTLLPMQYLKWVCCKYKGMLVLYKVSTSTYKCYSINLIIPSLVR